MLIVISPAKTLDYKTPARTSVHTIPDFLDHSQILIDDLRRLSPHEISTLMGISDALGSLNYDRFHAWTTPFTTNNAKQALLAFKGDVYTGLQAETFTAGDFKFAQKHLRILSGLYGLLRPMDLMQAYRLEMGTRFADVQGCTSAVKHRSARAANARGKDLYAFWNGAVTDALNKQLKTIKSHLLINLASNEYFKVIQPKHLQAEIVTPVFKDLKGDQYKVVSFFAKKARGMMSAFIIKNRLTDAQQLKDFDSEGYGYNAVMSTGNELVFTRD